MCLDFVITVYFSMVPTYSVLNTFTPEVIPNNLPSQHPHGMDECGNTDSCGGDVIIFVGEVLLVQ